MDDVIGPHECDGAARARRLANAVADRRRRRRHLHQYDPYLVLVGDKGAVRRRPRILPPRAPLYLYGPYKRDGAHTAPSNAAFDADLRAKNAAWGVRDLEAAAELAAGEGFSGPDIVEMPANNLSLIFRRLAETVER